MDKVLIEGLKVDAVIGVYDWERQIEQPLVIDVTMTVDTRQAAATDELVHAVNYAEISERLISLTRELKPKLIETLADRLAQLILEQYVLVQVVQIKVKKPLAVRQAQTVAVEIVRDRDALLARSGQ